MAYLLPGRVLACDVGQITNHDDRAAFVCALTALAVAFGDFSAVGDADGWIILPPWRFVQAWAQAELEENARAEVEGCLYRSNFIAT
jgi:hypothetical protein